MGRFLRSLLSVAAFFAIWTFMRHGCFAQTEDVDGIHADPAAVRLAWDHLGPDRFVLITDGMQATGLGEGIYILGDREVFVGAEGPRIGRAILAGSTLTMDVAVSNLQEWTSATLLEATACASENPARLLREGAAA